MDAITLAGLVVAALAPLAVSQVTTQPAVHPAAADAHAIEVAVTPDEVVVRLGEESPAGAAGEVVLHALPIYDAGDVAKAGQVWRGKPDSSGEVRLPRRDEQGRDRLFSAFMATAPGERPAWRDARYPTDLSALPAADFPFPEHPSIKGLSCPVDLDDALAVGAVHLNHNIDVAALFDRENRKADDPGVIAHTYNGRTYLFDRANIDDHDAHIGDYTRRGARVSAILLNATYNVPASMPQLIHPWTDVENAPMKLGGFNIATRDGLEAYAAAIDFIAGRYSRPDAQHGLLANYIVGNEVTSHWIWNNFGRRPADEVIEQYERGLRVTDAVVRSHHRDARAFLSNDNAWAHRGAGTELEAMRGDEYIGGVNARSKAEGDYPWGVAFHPYPSNLRDPRFWDDPLARHGFDTPRVTPLNMEVLAAYLRKPEMRHDDEPRRVLFSEQGFNRPDTPDGEDVQAAAYALAVWRMRQVPEVEAFHLHRHVDHLGEGGLLLGMWTADPAAAPENQEKPLAKVKLHEVFSAMDTEREAEARRFAEGVIGRSFDDFPIREDIPDVAPLDGRPGVRWYYDLAEHVQDATTDTVADLAARTERRNDTTVLAVFEHPSDEGPGKAVWRVETPELREGELLLFEGEAVVTGPTDDGVAFAISANGQELWSSTRTDQTPEPFKIDLTRFAGKPVDLALHVDGLGNTDHDWATWVDPAVVVRPEYDNSGAAGIEISKQRDEAATRPAE